MDPCQHLQKVKNLPSIANNQVFVFYFSGVSIEFLCFPRPEEPIEHVMSCLQALATLLESPCAKIHLAKDQVKIQTWEEITSDLEFHERVMCFCVEFLIIRCCRGEVVIFTVCRINDTGYAQHT